MKHLRESLKGIFLTLFRSLFNTCNLFLPGYLRTLEQKLYLSHTREETFSNTTHRLGIKKKKLIGILNG